MLRFLTLLTEVTVGKSRREYTSEEPVYLQGEPANAVYYFESGKLKVPVVSKGEREALVAILSESSFFGEV